MSTLAQQPATSSRCTQLDPKRYPTTLMVKNLPSRSPVEEIREAIESVCGADAFDFFYVPQHEVNRKSKSQNKGYAFINFRSPSCSRSFAEFINTHRPTLRQRTLEVSPATVQGLSQSQVLFRHKNAAPWIDKDCAADNMPINMQIERSPCGLSEASSSAYAAAWPSLHDMPVKVDMPASADISLAQPIIIPVNEEYYNHDVTAVTSGWADVLPRQGGTGSTVYWPCGARRA
eukprot:TRINITY_DN36551_c0_g1_i1.p1 TRINITY_DN36551_c0_g1~~TRINITY_DN36551_c0_g1_i1.p1  ORF type:complete len:232 (+),score=38.38 TRINITY_DN36551_c0_g1_i1:112-807(+)